MLTKGNLNFIKWVSEHESRVWKRRWTLNQKFGKNQWLYLEFQLRQCWSKMAFTLLLVWNSFSFIPTSYWIIIQEWKDYLHSAFSSSGFTERMNPCAHLGHNKVLAWVDNSSLLLQRSQLHQKNFASFKCCRRFNVPCGEDLQSTVTRSIEKNIKNLQSVSIRKSYGFSLFQRLRCANC